ncbi:type II toxin-antitoxin system VapC family toxin [Mesorhizobium sp. CGMCC 1.15528]|uniref:Type II toxin-antitoxin system VapC family toxin n=2 Tax=Phyllobacteriaceae TaxID=69277 RepID=A0A7C9R6N8_9HYPH|nr:type II toxin-antitoxin system VapC family toxin [Mesorhizobium zhangyense]
MEVMIGVDAHVEDGTRSFLDGFDLVPIDRIVAEGAVAIRRKHRIKLPDAIIWASAETNSMVLVTRNSKDFPEASPSVRIPYKL